MMFKRDQKVRKKTSAHSDAVSRISIVAALIIFSVTLLYSVHFFSHAKNAPNLPGHDISFIFSSKLPSYFSAIQNLDLSALTGLWRNSDLDPGYLTLAGIIMRILGKDYMLTTFLINIFSLFLILFFVYLLGRTLEDEATGILSVVIISLLPLVYQPFTDMYLNFQLMWITAAAVYFLIRSNYFEDRFWSVAMAAACSWGIHSKYPFGTYIAGPLAVGLYKAVYEARRKNFRYLINFLLFAVIVASLTSPFILSGHRLNHILTDPITERTGYPVLSFRNLRIFTVGLWESQLSPPFFILFLTGLYFFIKRHSKRITAVFLSWILLPNIILLLIPHWKSPRYFMPLLPAAAIISVAGIKEIRHTLIRNALLFMLLAAGLFQYRDFNCSPESLLNEREIFSFRNEPLKYYSLYPEKSVWLHKTPEDVMMNPIIYTRIREALRSFSVPEAENASQKIIPRILIQPRYILNQIDKNPIEIGWLYSLESLLWLDGVNARLEATERNTGYSSKPDFALTVISEKRPNADYYDDSYIHELKRHLFTEPSFMGYDSLPEADSGEWAAFRKYHTDLRSSVKRRELIYEEGSFDGRFIKVYLYRIRRD